MGIGGLRLQRRGGGQGGSDYKGVEVDQGAQATEEERGIRGLRLQRRGGRQEGSDYRRGELRLQRSGGGQGSYDY